MTRIILVYLVIINIVGLLLMLIDKRRAIENKWRIPEKTLFLIAILGGSIGSIIGMNTFRHKTKHWYFVIGMPTIFIVQIVLVSYFYFH